MADDDLILRRQPMSLMSDEELVAGITQLRERREMLVAEARAKKAAAKEPKPKAPRVPKEVDPVQAAMLALLEGKE